jgi:hypothetical protein
MFLTKKKALDLSLYVLISVVVIGCIIIAAVLKVPQKSFNEWLSITGFSVIVFAQLIGSSRMLWRRASFWIFISALFIVHFGTLVVFGRLYTDATTFQMMLAFFAESMLLRVLRQISFDKYLRKTSSS